MKPLYKYQIPLKSCVRLYWQVPPPTQPSNNVHINWLSS